MAWLLLCLPGTALAQAPPAPVLTISAEPRGVTPMAEFAGRVRALDRVELRPRVAGVLGPRLVADGATVAEGDVLFAVDRAPFEAVVEQRRAQVTAAEATLEVADAQHQRARELWRTRSVPEATLDQRRGDELRARAELALARAALREAELNLSFTEVRAPFAGQLGAAAFSPGSLVGPDGPPLAVLVRQDPMHAAFAVSQRQLVEARRGAAGGLDGVRARLILPDGSRYAEEGRLDFGGVQADPRTDSVPLRAVFPNPARLLLDGMGVRVVLELAAPRRAILVPQSALLADQRGTYVLVVEDGRAARRDVRTEPRRDGLAEVTQGLSPGDLVIAEGQLRIRPGGAVTARPLPAP